MSDSMRASKFVSSIGLNVHMAAFNTSTNSAKLLAALNYLGVQNIRVVAAEKFVSATGGLGTLAAAGIKFDMLLPSFVDPLKTITVLKAFDAAHPDAIAAIEGPNEINNWPITYNGLTGAAAGHAFVNAAAGMIKGTSLADVKFYDLTGAPRSAESSANASQFVNIHPYPQNGNQPGVALLNSAARHTVAGKELVITEAGYHTGKTTTGWEGVDLATQAKLTLNLLADAVKLGVSSTYLYQLKDNKDPNGEKVDANLGLFDSMLNAKPVATAIHNLTSILADKTATAASFATHALNYTMTGLPETGKSLLLEKSNGMHDILVWAEPDIWDEVADRPIKVAPSPVTVGFDGPVSVRIYDPLVSDAAIATYSGVRTVQVAVTDHPLVIEVTGGGAKATSAPAAFTAPIWMSGTVKDDIVMGAAGNDRLSGMGGNDTIKAGAGNDWLYGAAGADKLYGGAGADIFAYKTLGDSALALAGRDEIMDFNRAEGDKIDLSAIIANQAKIGRDPFFLAGDSFTRHAGELIQVRTGDGYLLQGDLLGNGKAHFAIMVHNLSAPLISSDFVF